MHADEAQPHPGADYLTIAQRLGVLAQALEICRVRRGLDPQPPDGWAK